MGEREFIFGDVVFEMLNISVETLSRYLNKNYNNL